MAALKRLRLVRYKKKKGIYCVVGVIRIAIISTQHLAKNNRVLQNFQWGTKPRGFAKVKFTLQQATKAQRGIRDIGLTLLFP